MPFNKLFRVRNSCDRNPAGAFLYKIKFVVLNGCLPHSVAGCFTLIGQPNLKSSQSTTTGGNCSPPVVPVIVFHLVVHHIIDASEQNRCLVISSITKLNQIKIFMSIDGTAHTNNNEQSWPQLNLFIMSFSYTTAYFYTEIL